MVEESEAMVVSNGRSPQATKHHQNGRRLHSIPDKKLEEDEFVPPDGGVRAWLVLVASFFCNGILFGVLNSYSVLYDEFLERLQKAGSSKPDSEAALVGALAMGTTFLVSSVSGVLTDFIGLRQTTFLGGLIASGGMFLSSFCLDNIMGLYVTFGVMYGLGGALAYTPSLAVLGHYFKRYLGVVNGVVTAGSSVFTIIMPFVIEGLLKSLGLAVTLRLLALIASLIMAFAFLYKPTHKTSAHKKIQWDNAFNVSLLKNKKYITWAIVIAISLFGYFVPYVYMSKFVQKNFSGKVDGKVPILCIGVTSGVGRLLFGYVADFPKVNRILLQQLSFLSIGILTMLLPSSTNSPIWLIVISLGMGLFDGCFISLLGPIAFDICGREGATQAIGLLLGICSVPLTIGPYVAGLIFEQTQSYTLPFILAGIPPTVGSIAMFLTRVMKTPPDRKEEPLNGNHLTSSGLTDGHKEEEGPL